MNTLILKSKSYVITIICLFFISAALGQSITITSTSPSTFCANTATTITINFSESGFNGNRTFTAQLSNSSGSFTSPTVIGSTSFNTNNNSSGTIQGTINQPAGIYQIRIAQGSTFSPTTCIAVFPTAPVITAPANTCASAFNLPTVTAVPGFNVQYSIDGGAFSASPSTTTPGCHTIQARYVLAVGCGSIPAGTAGPAGCNASNTVSVVIFPEAPPAPTVNSGCGPITVTPPPTVAGFNTQYSFNDGATWGANTPPTADNCDGYRIRTRYVLAEACGSTPAGATSSNPACATSPATIRVIDTQAPVVATAEGADANIGCNPTAQQIEAAFAAPTFTDNCGTPTVEVTNTSATNGCVRSDTRTWTATDACDNTTATSQTITYTVDTQAPDITCPAPVTVQCASEVPAPNTALITATDNCGGTITKEFVGDQISNQTCANRYTITRTYRATDACENSSTCTQIITVNDNTGPVVQNCPSNITVAPTTLSGTVVNYTMPTATDNCGGNPSRVQTSGKPSGSIFPIGRTTNTYEFTDECGNKSSCTFTVTVTNPYCDNNPKNRKVYVCHNGNTICISVNALQAHLDHGDYLGPCTTPPTTQQRGLRLNAQGLDNSDVELFDVVFSPNPTTSSFSLKVESSSNELINIRIFDALGKTITSIKGVKKGSPVTFGEKYRGGTYFAEVIQGAKHKTVKLIKLN